MRDGSSDGLVEHSRRRYPRHWIELIDRSCWDVDPYEGSPRFVPGRTFAKRCLNALDDLKVRRQFAHGRHPFHNCLTWMSDQRVEPPVCWNRPKDAEPCRGRSLSTSASDSSHSHVSGSGASAGQIRNLDDVSDERKIT